LVEVVPIVHDRTDRLRVNPPGDRWEGANSRGVVSTVTDSTGSSPVNCAGAKERMMKFSFGNCLHKTRPVLIFLKWAFDIHVGEGVKDTSLSA
jgi:hypothetical protein